MGLKRWLARRGAVGGTARWAANGYHFFRRRHPDHSEFADAALFRLMIVTRYKLMPDPNKEEYLLTECDSVEGLIGLVIEVLKVEAALHENSGDNIYEFVEVIDEELRKAGIAEATRFGGFSDIGDYWTQATYPPEV